MVSCPMHDRSDLIVLPEPGIDCDLSLFGGVVASPGL